MTDIVRIATNKRRGWAVAYNGVVYLGGMVADDRSQGIKSQTTQALAKVDAALVRAGADKSRLLTAQIWLQDISRDFAEMNLVWDDWVESDAFPARATAQCPLGAPDALIEIIVTAAIHPA